jgi:hypothetical protein
MVPRLSAWTHNIDTTYEWKNVNQRFSVSLHLASKFGCKVTPCDLRDMAASTPTRGLSLPWPQTGHTGVSPHSSEERLLDALQCPDVRRNLNSPFLGVQNEQASTPARCFAAAGGLSSAVPLTIPDTREDHWTLLWLGRGGIHDAVAGATMFASLCLRIHCWEPSFFRGV